MLPAQRPQRAAARGRGAVSGRAGCRSHLLVLPSVVCATRVAATIAEALGGVTITHQHGCSQVGDDATLRQRLTKLIAIRGISLRPGSQVFTGREPVALLVVTSLVGQHEVVAKITG